MRLPISKVFSVGAMVLIFMAATLSLSPSAFAQGGNSITGQVFGLDRRPVADAYVELMDDLYRTLGREKTSASGRFGFYGLSAGRFKLKVKPFGTDYDEQEQDIEIVNFARGSGNSRTVGSANEQRDIYLRLRKGVTPETMASVVFAQNIPDGARKLYDKALLDLDAKKEQEAYTNLKASLEIFPKYYAALELLGTEYVRKGHYEAAQVLLTLAVDVNPRGYKSWYGLAYSLHSQKKSDEALVAVQKSIEINALAAEPMFLSGSIMRQSKRFDVAEKQLIKARDLSHDTIPDIHWELALLYANGLKKYADAARELKLFLKARPDTKDAENIKKLIAQLEEKAKAT